MIGMATKMNEKRITKIVESLRKLQGGGSLEHREYEWLIEAVKKLGD